MMSLCRHLLRLAVPLVSFSAYAGPLAAAGPVVEAYSTDQPPVVDGAIDDWSGVAGTIVPLSGTGGADRVELRAAVHGDRIYVLAIWADPTADELHKPYRWNERLHAYERISRMEDRFALSLRMAGSFSANKLDGSEFLADVWHWKANRSNLVGLAHDKMWRVSRTPFEDARAFEMADGDTIYLRRHSDAGDRLYKPVRYLLKQEDVMPLYEVNAEAEGSIADVRAKGVWRDGRWYLEMSRELDTGHDDDAVIPREGAIEVAVAVFDHVSYNIVDGGTHSVSEKFLLRTHARPSA